MRATVVGIAVLVLVGVSGAQDTSKKDISELEGEWSMVSGEANGQSLPEAAVKSAKRVARKGETTITIGGKLFFKAKFTIDPTKKPKAID
jgi:uncharacterized protein (TIGR03067 family)